MFSLCFSSEICLRNLKQFSLIINLKLNPMKNITVNPTIWQTATYSPYVADKFNNANRNTEKDLVLNREVKKSSKENSRFKFTSSYVLRYFKPLRNLLIRTSTFTNTFNV